MHTSNSCIYSVPKVDTPATQEIVCMGWFSHHFCMTHCSTVFFCSVLCSCTVLGAELSVRASWSIKGQASQAGAWGANLQGELRCHWSDQKYGAVKLTFTLAKGCFWKLSAI
jgi:hypothetical protein